MTRLSVLTAVLLALTVVLCAADLSEVRSRAEGGDAVAQFKLGVMYKMGQGVAADYAEAVKWYRRAAEQGYASAQNNLGLMYMNGQGLPADYVQAYKWLNLARAGGNENAARNLDLIEKKMTPEQIAEGQRLSREWWEKHGGAEK